MKPQTTDPYRRIEAGPAPRIWGISDLHFGLGSNKPMDIFGVNWADHHLKVQAAWLERVQADDLVLIPGDISWGLKAESARPDLDFIEALPGRKLIGKGNHCHWWPKTHAKFAALGYETFTLAHGVMHVFDDLAILFVRGWWMREFYGRFDEKKDGDVWNAELERLRLLLRLAPDDRPLLLAAHFPFVMKRGIDPELPWVTTPFHEVLVHSAVRHCVYGHLHGDWCQRGPNGPDQKIDGIEYRLLSVDAIDFAPQLLYQPGLGLFAAPVTPLSQAAAAGRMAF